MSKSPKYTMAQLGGSIANKLKGERDDRKRRRREAESQQRQRILTQTREQARTRREELAARLRALRPERDSAAVDEARRMVDDLVTQIDAAASLADLGVVVNRLSQAELLTNQLSIELEHRRHQQESRDHLAVITALLEGMPGEVRTRFDLSGAKDVEAWLQRLREASGAEPAEVKALSEAVIAHLATVAQRREEFEQRRLEAGAEVGRLTTRLESLKEDADKEKVPLKDGERATGALEMLRDRLTEGGIDEVMRYSPALDRRLTGIEDTLDTAIDQLHRLQAILTAVVKVLPTMGFAVENREPTPTADGAIGVRARRAAGDSLGLIVQEEAESSHRVFFHSEAVQRESPGVGGTACKEMVDMITSLQSMPGNDGVAFGPVGWDGMPTDQVAHPGRPSDKTTDKTTGRTAQATQPEKRQWRK